MTEVAEQVPEFNFDDFELVNYVRIALKDVSLGDSGKYSQLVAVLHHNWRLSPDESALLVTSLKALSGAVSHIDYLHHKMLVDSIFLMSMWNYGPDVMDALMELVVSLAATNGKYLDSCLEMLVSNFLPPVSFLEIVKSPRGVTRKEQVLERVHSALNEIAHLVPLAPARLFPIIRQGMPHYMKKEPDESYFENLNFTSTSMTRKKYMFWCHDIALLPSDMLIAMYVENIFKLESSPLGQLVGTLMLTMTVVDRLIELDVEIGWDDILSDDPTKGIFELELECEDLADTENDGVEFHREYLLTGKEVPDKLDSLMVLTFEHLKSSYDNGRLIEVFESLLQSFQRTILNAYKSKFAQFVMFYACSLDPENCGVRFAEYLADVFTSSNFPLLTRMSSVAYLASYMARAKFLRTSFITTMLERLAYWCSNYCQLHNGDINPKAHRAFYAGCQAIMYVLCFRMRSIIETPHLKIQLHRIPLGQILKNSLDPLKVCLPSIVDEFARQAKAAHLFKEAEKEAKTSVFSDVLESEHSRAYGGVERLDMFFPFDPCLLQRSDRYIEPNFVSWGMVKPTYHDDDTDSNASDEEQDPFDVDTPRARTAESLEEHDYFDEFNDSLNKMSITPRESTLMKFGERLMQMPSRIRPSTSPE